MGKTSKWIRNLLTGKKDRDKAKEKEKEGTTVPTENPTTPLSTTPNTPKEKRRWSFRRSTTTGTAPRDSNSVDSIPATPPPVVQNMSESENEQKKHTVVTTAAADAPVAKMQAATAETVMKTAAAASADIQLTTSAIDEQIAFEEAAATKIQSVFRSYLARKALCALKGLVKLQALVRGHLVRKQATATLRCMQALVTVQARARAQRIKLVEDGEPSTQRHSVHRSPQRNRSKQSYDEMDRGMDDNIKIVEMDLGEARGSATSRHSYSNHQQVERSDQRFSAYYPPRPPSRQENQPQFSPAPSAMTDMSPRTYSGHFEEYSFTTAQSSPHCHSSVSKPDPLKAPFAFPRPEYAESMSHDYTLFPNYMANTQSSKAKARSQSAPKQRPDSYERPPSRRRASIEGRNVPRAVRMQRSSSHVGSTAQGYQYSGSIKLDRSAVSLKDSECGSTSTILTNTTYCRSLVSYEPHAKRY